MTPKLYEGTKRLHAQPMTRGEYNAYRGWEIPADENPADDGYLVEYQDGGKANDPRHAGYISWSPKDVFERSYKEVPQSSLPPHQQRVLDEKRELDDKLQKLTAFISSEKFSTIVQDEAERVRLVCQEETMKDYSAILAERIEAFGAAPITLPVVDPGPDSLEREIQARLRPSVCKGERCMSTDGGFGHSRECIAEAGRIQGWTPTAEDFATAGPSAPLVGSSIEQEIQAKANNGPRVTPDALKAEIVSERYFTAADGVLGAYRAGGDVHSFGGTPSQATHQALGLLTFCVLVLKNGTKIVGINYGAIDPSQHSAKRGREEARAHAIEQIWPLLGFRLRDKLAAGS